MDEAIETLLITQARTGSTRLPNKVLMEINGESLLEIQLGRLKTCTNVDKIVVGTTVEEADSVIESLCKSWDIDVMRGSVDDVLDRYYKIAMEYQPKWVVRVTSDCPLIDPELIDAVILFARVNDVDYASNVLIENFPDGQDVEVFKLSTLEDAWVSSVLRSDREHVTPYIRDNCTFFHKSRYSGMNFPCLNNYSHVRMTVDEAVDFKVISEVVMALGKKESWLTYSNYIIDNELANLNGNIVRNEGFLKSLKNN